jgi:RNA polymerase sigma factor (sigma-70 family)
MMPSGAHIEDYLPLVRRLATRLAQKLPPSIEFDDLVQEGACGLMQAAQRFDPGANDNFGLYAQRRILGSMLDSVRRRHWIAATCAPLEDAGQVAATENLDADQHQITAGVRKEIAALSTAERQVVLLVYTGGLSQAQTAARLRVSKDRVKTVHREALDRLRPYLRHLRPAA